MDLKKLFPVEKTIPNPCKMCDKWTPEAGCRHYLPDSETILLMAGYRIYKPGIDTRQKKFLVTKTGLGKTHRFESLAKAAYVLIHSAAGEKFKVSITEPSDEKLNSGQLQQHIVSGSLLFTCGDCGQELTEVRPGKHQCDNVNCKSNDR